MKTRMNMRRSVAAVALTIVLAMAGLQAKSAVKTSGEKTMPDATTEVASFGAGCFWCSEAIFEELDGVVSVTSGYQGGEPKKSTYKQVCSGNTGHAEVVRVEYDPERVSYDKLLDLFWKMHDPTTLNRQGADVGTQYRSVIFYHTEAQREAAKRSLKAMEASEKFDDPIVTEIKKAPTFHEAESYHQDYYRNNPSAPYSRYIRGKLDKLGME